MNDTGEEEITTNSVVYEDRAAVGCEIRSDGLACLTQGNQTPFWVKGERLGEEGVHKRLGDHCLHLLLRTWGEENVDRKHWIRECLQYYLLHMFCRPK